MGGDTIEYKFNEPFAEAPVVFVTPVSTYKNYPMMARVWDVTKDGFKVVMTRQYGMKEKYPAIVGQRVSYVAIEKGTTTASGKILTVKDTTFTFKYATTTNNVKFGRKLEDPSSASIRLSTENCSQCSEQVLRVLLQLTASCVWQPTHQILTAH